MASGKIIRKIIVSSLAPEPVGPYNQAVLVDKTLYISGVLGVNKSTGKLVEGGIEAETRQVLTNMKYILEEAGSSLEKVVKTTVLLNNIEDFPVVNKVYAEFFVKDYPVRMTYQVAKLPAGARIEIDGIALVGAVQTVRD